MRNYLFFLLFLFTVANAFAQQPLWLPVSVDQGLPDPNITALERTDNGTLFVGTAIGLFSYDGFSFHKVDLGEQGKLSPYINTLLIYNDILFVGAREAVIRYDLLTGETKLLKKPLNAPGGVIEFYPDHINNKLFILTSNGTLIMDVHDGAFKSSGSIPDIRLRKLRIANQDDIHAYTTDHAFIRILRGKTTTTYSDPKILDAYWWEKENSWLLVKADGIYLLSGGYDHLKKLNIQVNLNTTENKWLYPDKNGGFWVQTAGGFLFLPNASVNNPEFYYHETGNPYSFTSSTAQAFFTGPEGIQWVGGDGSGLSYLNKTGRGINYLTNEEARCQHFWCFKLEPSGKRLLCGTTHGILSCTIENERLSGKTMLHPPGFSRFSVNAIADLNDKEYILSVYKEGFWALDKRTLRFRRLDAVNRAIGTTFIYGIRPISGNRLALLTQFNTWLLDSKTMQVSRLIKEFPNFSMFSFLEDSLHRFIQAGGFGLQFINSRRELLYYYARSDSTQNLSSDVIFDIMEYQKGTYLLATMGGGLCLFREKDRSFRKLPLVTDPLNIFGILRLSSETVILTTSGGLCRYNLRTGESAILNKSNALPFNDFNQNALTFENEWCFAGGEKGMLMIRKDKLAALFSDDNQILVRDQEKLLSSLRLPPGRHSMNLQLGLKKIVPTSRLRFAYRIEGIDTGWQVLPYGQNELVYSYLPSGSYNLEIKLLDESGLIHAQTVNIPLEVIPYFYQTAWFRGLGILLITVIIFLIVRYFALLRLRWKLNRLDAERKVMIERARISRELHDNLGSQLTYLISGLETTGLFLSRNNLDKTANNLEKMQSAARDSMQQLRDSIWALKPGNMTFHTLTEQCERWITRVTEPHQGLHFSIHKGSCEDFTLDPLHGLNIFRILQEAVHNALKHAGARQLDVGIECKGNTVSITIRDDGKGIPVNRVEGNGLASIRQRASELKAEVRIESDEGKGTSILLILDKNTLKG